MTTSQPLPRTPRGPGWVLDSVQSAGPRWRHVPSGILVISTVDPVDADGLQWHISVSAHGAFPTPTQARFAQEAFDLLKGEEDNVGGVRCRHVWLHVDPSRRRPRKP